MPNVVILSVIMLSLVAPVLDVPLSYFILDFHQGFNRFHQVAAEFVSKVINTAINLAGITGLIIGLAETQQLTFKDPEKKRIR